MLTLCGGLSRCVNGSTEAPVFTLRSGNVHKKEADLKFQKHNFSLQVQIILCTEKLSAALSYFILLNTRVEHPTYK